jgi:hypothetical protein
MAMAGFYMQYLESKLFHCGFQVANSRPNLLPVGQDGSCKWGGSLEVLGVRPIVWQPLRHDNVEEVPCSPRCLAETPAVGQPSFAPWIVRQARGAAPRCAG